MCLTYLMFTLFSTFHNTLFAEDVHCSVSNYDTPTHIEALGVWPFKPNIVCPCRFVIYAMCWTFRVCHGSSPPGLLRIMQNSSSSVTLKLKLTLTLTLTLTDRGGAVLTLMLGYRPGGELPWQTRTFHQTFSHFCAKNRQIYLKYKQVTSYQVVDTKTGSRCSYMAAHTGSVRTAMALLWPTIHSFPTVWLSIHCKSKLI